MSFFGSIAKAAIDTAMIPVEVVKDVATLGSLLSDDSGSYTKERAKRICEDLEDAYDDLD